MSSTERDSWGDLAPLYAQIELLTTPPAQTLLERVSALYPLSTPGSTTFDNGCGTGVLTSVIKNQFPKVPVVATDASDGMISVLRRRIYDQKWTNISARVADSRFLSDFRDGEFTHTLSTFMVCLAPEPDKIVGEMWRVTAPGGVLGLAVWGDPRFGRFYVPWDKACRELMPGYEPPAAMGAEWTLAENVQAGLEKVGFKDVEVWVEHVFWHFESAEAVTKYFFEAGNPATVKVMESFKARGGDMAKARVIYEKEIKDEGGREDGSIGVPIIATFATARK